MYGNTLGWSISAVIVLLTAGMIALLEKVGGTSGLSSEFAAHPQYLEKLALPADPRSLVPMGEGCASGEAYRAAIEAVRGEPVKYEDFLLSRSGAAVPKLPAVDKVLEGARCTTMTLFYRKPDEVVNYKFEREPIKAIRDAGRATIVVGLRKKADPRKPDAEGAMKYFEAAFCLGAKLFEERVVYEELEAGLVLMREASVALAGVVEEKDPGRARALRDFQGKLLEFERSAVQPVWRVISSIDQRVIEEHAGDVYRLATASREPVWRTEAILKLGRYRFNAGRRGDQLAAERTVKRLASDTAIGAAPNLAAKAARDLTSEQYKMLGT